ncbi:MAG: DUF3363 domain-containing protein [Pseudomonadota bacterium]
MRLADYNIEEFKTRLDEGRPLIVTTNNARKALMSKINRSGGLAMVRKKSRLTRRGIMTRGNSFAGYSFGQRVVVKIRYVKHKAKFAQALAGAEGVGKGRAGGGGASSLRSHVRYISRGAAGKDGEKAVLFNAVEAGVEAGAFVAVCEHDRHHWRFIISPENGHQIEDFQGYVRGIMGKVEEDLGTKLEWVSAVHYDTDDIHAHVIVRGRNDSGQDLVIGQDYIKEGIRRRAQEIATELLGERSLKEIQKSLEAEVNALRSTSLDRFIEKQASQEHVIDVRKKQNFDKSLFYEGLIKGRLRYLASAGLAKEEPSGVFTLKEDYKQALAQVSEKNDVIKRLYKSGVTTGLDDLSLYSLKGGEGRGVEGRVVGKGLHDEMTDRQYIVVKDVAAKLHYVPVLESERYHQLRAGSLVRVSPGDQSTGKADHNIRQMAEKNRGIYDPEQHRAHIEKHMSFIAAENRPKYLESHQVRLATLEKNGIVKALGKGRYEIPADVVERGAEVTREINAREKKRFYPKLDVLSVKPPERLVSSSKKTWLDKELFQQAKGTPSLSSYDEATTKALESRKAWLVQQDLGVIQSNGTFALRDGALKKLDRMEVYAAGEKLAGKLGLRFSDEMVREGKAMRFEGHVQLETGIWAVVSKGRSLHLAPVEEQPKAGYGQQVTFKQLESGKFEVQAARVRSRGKDKEQEMEL